jgi:hypothetical protein
MRTRTQLILMAALATLALPSRAMADTWSVSGAFTSVFRIQRPSHRPLVQRTDGTFDFTAALAPDGSYEITGPFASCEALGDDFGPRGAWNGSERAFVQKALQATVRTMMRGCRGGGPIHVSALSADLRLGDVTLSGRASVRATLRLRSHPPLLGRATIRIRVIGTRTAPSAS